MLMQKYAKCKRESMVLIEQVFYSLNYEKPPNRKEMFTVLSQNQTESSACGNSPFIPVGDKGDAQIWAKQPSNRGDSKA